MLYPLSYERWCLASLRHSESLLCEPLMSYPNWVSDSVSRQDRRTRPPCPLRGCRARRASIVARAQLLRAQKRPIGRYAAFLALDRDLDR